MIWGRSYCWKIVTWGKTPQPSCCHIQPWGPIACDEAVTCHGWQTDTGQDDECLQVLPREEGAAPAGCVAGREGKPKKRLLGKPWPPSLPPRRLLVSSCLGRAGYGRSPWAHAREGRGAGCREVAIASQSQVLTWHSDPCQSCSATFGKICFFPVTAKKPLASQARYPEVAAMTIFLTREFTCAFLVHPSTEGKSISSRVLAHWLCGAASGPLPFPPKSSPGASLAPESIWLLTRPHGPLTPPHL